MEKAMYRRDWGCKAVRRAEERLSGRTAWLESHSQGRTASGWCRRIQNRKAKSLSCVQTSRTYSVLDGACGYGARSASQRKGSEK